MKKINIRLRSRQRQRVSRRTILILSTSCFLLVSIGITLYLNFSRVDEMSAKDDTHFQVLIAPEFQPVNEKSLSAPLVDNRLSTNPNAIYIRKAKPLQATTQASLQ